ncbi:STAS domain-containing protein [Tardiphaga sp.]|uniref:STAS domain-containing protein n=1 Tax=Tardiphaga sp. TaxID=1926292 RepID=UPI0025F3407C|nr:STAS domain-containing protein [Tardiphaga sp.]
MQFQINSEKTQALMTGDLTFADHASFKALIGSLLKGRGSPIVIDLSELDFIDSAGLGMLLLIRDEANKAARKLVLRGPIGQVKRMFGVTKFETLFVVEES